MFVSWWQILLVALGFGFWSVFMLLVGAAIMKSAYTIPNDTRNLER